MKLFNSKIFYGFLLFLFVVTAIDFSSGILLDFLYKRSKTGTTSQEYYIVNKTNEELLIFGPSTASYHYDSALLQDKLGMSVYNAGREGAGIYFQYGVLLATLNRYKPKMIIYDFTYKDLYNKGGSFTSEVITELAPFYGKINTEFDSLLVQSSFDKLKYQSNLIKYNGKFFNIISGNIFSDRPFVYGYRALDGALDKPPLFLEEKNLIVDESLKRCLYLFLKRIKQEKIEVYVSISPQLINFEAQTFEPLYQICRELDIPIINNVSNQQFLSNHQLFKDKQHLNREGSAIFTSIVAESINFNRLNIRHD